jgi:acyl-CoA dehydrogenase
MEIFNENHIQFRNKVKKFVTEEINPYAEEWEKNRQIPKVFWEKMGEMGFLGLCYDKEYGGLNLDATYSLILIEELAKSRCGGVEAAVALHNDMSTTYLNMLGTGEQKKRYLKPCIKGKTVCAIAMTEPDAGSDLAAIRMTAVKMGDNYLLNGQKVYITNGYYGDVIITAAKTNMEANPAHRGISLFIVEKGTAGLSTNKLEKMGLHASDTAELFYEDCQVPAKNLLGQEGSGFYALMKNLQKERLINSVFSIGYCQKMIEDTIAFLREHIDFKKTTGSDQVIKHKIVEMVSEAEMIKIFVYHCCQEFVSGRDITKQISMAKYLSAELDNKIAYTCAQLHGGYASLKQYPIANDFANVRAHNIAAGTTEIMKEIIASRIGL